MAPSKNIRMSDNQKEHLLDFMMQNPVLSANRLTGLAGRAKAQEMWEELAEELNAVRGGAIKNTRKWKLSWFDWKLNTRNKANNIAQFERGEADEDVPPPKLSPMEEKLIAFLDNELSSQSIFTAECGIVGPSFEEVVYGHEGSAEEFTEEVSATVGADNSLVYKVNVAPTTNGAPGTPDVGGVQRVRSGSDIEAEGLPTSAATPDVGAKRWKMASTIERGAVKRPPPADHAGYASPGDGSSSLVLRQIRDSLRDLGRTGLRRAAACERRAAAAERIATATERKAAACERKAAACERIAAAKEQKYCV